MDSASRQRERECVQRDVNSACVEGLGLYLFFTSSWNYYHFSSTRNSFVKTITFMVGFGVLSQGSLKTVEVFNGTRAGINGLISSFVKLLQEENPSRESTIMRTAGKLTPFHFNRMPEDNDYNGQVASRRRQKKYNLKTKDALPPESFCPICNSPLKISSFGTSINFENGKTNPNGIGAACCASCQFQVLPNDPSSLEHFISLLPPSMVSQAGDNDRLSQRQLREQIEDCLLSDNEDGT